MSDKCGHVVRLVRGRMRKTTDEYAFNPQPTLADHFEMLAAQRLATARGRKMLSNQICDGTRQRLVVNQPFFAKMAAPSGDARNDANFLAVGRVAPSLVKATPASR